MIVNFDSVSILAVKQFQCEHCGMGYGHRQSLSRHLQSAHSDNGWPHKCHVCGMGFKVKRNLTEHRKTHTEVQHECKQCGKLFRKRISLRRYLEYHSGSIVKSFIGDVCGKAFVCFWNEKVLKFYVNNFVPDDIFRCRNIVAFTPERNHMPANSAHHHFGQCRALIVI